MLLQYLSRRRIRENWPIPQSTVIESGDQKILVEGKLETFSSPASKLTEDACRGDHKKKPLRIVKLSTGLFEKES